MKFKFDKVMVIDDNSIDLYIAGKLMAKHHFAENVLSFDTAMKALDYLEQHHNFPLELPEIILVDIYMPVMSGFDFLEAYDKLSPELKQHCRVYVVSSTIDEDDIRRVTENVNVVGFGVKSLSKVFLDTILVL